MTLQHALIGWAVTLAVFGAGFVGYLVLGPRRCAHQAAASTPETTPVPDAQPETTPGE